MILLANLLLGIAKIFHLILMVYMWILIMRAVFSWMPVPALVSLNVLIYKITEPFLKPVRRYFPPYKMGGIDISPMILIIVIIFIDTVFINSLSLYAQKILVKSTWNIYN